MFFYKHKHFIVNITIVTNVVVDVPHRVSLAQVFLTHFK